MPLLTYAGLSASKYRNDGRSSNHMAQNNEATKPLDKTCSSNSTYADNDVPSPSLSSGTFHQPGTPRHRVTSQVKVLPSAVIIKEHNVQISVPTSKLQERHTNNHHFQLSNNTAMRLYNNPHPHRENHQRLSSRRQAPYASAPSSPWRSGSSASSTSTYVVPASTSPARINSSFSRSQTSQRDELFGSDSSLSVTSMSRSANVGMSTSNGCTRIINKHNRSCNANTPQVSSPVPKHLNPLSRSHEEQSPRITHRMFTLGGSLSKKQQWLASGSNGLKSSTALPNGYPTNNLTKSHLQTAPTSRQSSLSTSVPPLSSSPCRKSAHCGTVNKSPLPTTSAGMTKSIRNSGRIVNAYTGNNHANATGRDTKNIKRQSFGSTPPSSSGMSKSDSSTYKGASKGLRYLGKSPGLTGENGKLYVYSPGIDTREGPSQITNTNVSPSLTAPSGTSTLLSTSLLNKVRKNFKNIYLIKVMLSFTLSTHTFQIDLSFLTYNYCLLRINIYVGSRNTLVYCPVKR